MGFNILHYYLMLFILKMYEIIYNGLILRAFLFPREFIEF